MPETILIERDGRVAVITVNRPDKLNALSQQVRDEMLAALAELERDDAVGVVVVTGPARRPSSPGPTSPSSTGAAPSTSARRCASRASTTSCRASPSR